MRFIQETCADGGVSVWQRLRMGTAGGERTGSFGADGDEGSERNRGADTPARSRPGRGRVKATDSRREAGKRHGERLRRGDKVSNRTRIPVWQSGQRMGGGTGIGPEFSGTRAVMESLWPTAGVNNCRAWSSRRRQAGLKMP